MSVQAPVNRRAVFGILFSLLVLQSCSIFEPIGGFFASGFENVTTYFNAYYNASRLFNEAEKEVLDAQFQSTGQEVNRNTPPKPIPTTATQKFNAVIDKCSQILTFHDKSAYADDALFLIGKSYFYLNDPLRAERKFGEMLQLYPDGNLAIDAQLWLLRTYEKLKKYPEAEELASAVVRIAQEEGEADLAAESFAIIGRMSLANGNQERAIENFRLSIQTGGNPSYAAGVQLQLAELHRARGDSLQALDDFANVMNLKPSLDEEFTARIRIVRILEDLKQFPEAERELDAIIDDFRFVSFMASLRLERATVLQGMGRLVDAMREYVYVDTAFARTESGARAAFALGELYEQTYLDYGAAKMYYTRASAIADPLKAKTARRKAEAFGTLDTQSKKLQQLDSTLAALSLREPDTVETSDSLASHSDSLTAVQRDSDIKRLRGDLAQACYEIGNVYYGELDLPDSAFLYYRRAYSFSSDSVLSPRILFIQGQIAQKYSERSYGDANELFRTIISTYPASPYASEARSLLGIPDTVKRDEAETLFQQAQSARLKGSPASAVVMLKQIVKDFPRSQYAPKSKYALALLYEDVIKKPDSALVWYKRAAEDHPGTLVGVQANRRIPPPPPEPVDSTAQPAAPADSVSASADSLRVREVFRDRIRRTKGEMLPDSTSSDGRDSER